MGRQVRLDHAKQDYSELKAIFEELTVLVDSRFYLLFKWGQAISEHLPSAELDRRKDAYFQIVTEWNSRIRLLHNRLRIHLGESRALAFLNYADDFDIENASSLHYRFVRATRLMHQATQIPSHLPIALKEMETLNWALVKFANDTADELVRRASLLRRLDFTMTTTTNSSGLLIAEHPGAEK